MSIDRKIVLLVVASFVVTSVSSLIIRGGPITEEQAIEISKTSDYVRQGLAEAKYGFYVYAEYDESWVVDNLREKGHGSYARVPEDAWSVTWMMPEHPPLPEAFWVFVLVDAETGDILFVDWGHSGDARPQKYSLRDLQCSIGAC